jgi:alpha-1,2-mannosyltransferase
MYRLLKFWGPRDGDAFDGAARSGFVLPSWLSLPGVIALVMSAGAYREAIIFQPLHGADMSMYRGAAQALRDGQPLYGVMYNGLPFTSPPITALAMFPATLVSLQTATKMMIGFGIVGTFVALLLVTRALGWRGLAGRIGVAAALTAVLVWTEPFQTTFLDGQLNVVVLLLVVGDLVQSDRSRFKGIGVGVAAALKLIPALFVVYLVLTRRFRAALTAVATFVALAGIGWILQPHGSTTYWLGGGMDSHNVLTDPRFVGEQSLQGTIGRLADTDVQGGPVWMLVVALVGIGGLALAVWAHRRGFEVMGMVVTAFVALMVSPSSWSHYWVWIGPMVLVIVDVAVRAAGAVRTLAAGLALAALIPFISWQTNPPSTGPMGPTGLIWTIRWHHDQFRYLAQDGYVFSSLVLLVAAAVWLYLTRERPVTAYERVPARATERDRAVVAAGNGVVSE